MEDNLRKLAETLAKADEADEALLRLMTPEQKLAFLKLQELRPRLKAATADLKAKRAEVDLPTEAVEEQTRILKKPRKP